MAEQPVRKSTKAAARDNAPWMPPRWDLADATAIQALASGNADPEQQKRALKWLIESACATYDLSFRPGAEEGRRDTDFAEGRRFVGAQIVKLLKLNIALLRRGNHA